MSETTQPYITQPTPSPMGERILSLLTQAQQSGMRLTGEELARRLEERNDRAIRIVIEQLIEQGHVIASSNVAPMGYYLVESIADATRYEKTLRSRALQTLKRLKNFRCAVARKFGTAYQLPLPTIDAALRELEK